MTGTSPVMTKCNPISKQCVMAVLVTVIHVLFMNLNNLFLVYLIRIGIYNSPQIRGDDE